MESTKVSDIIFSHLNQTWCQENVPLIVSQLFNKSIISRQEIREMEANFEAFWIHYSSLDDNDKSQDTAVNLQRIVSELKKIIEELDYGETETKKSFMVCNSSIFNKEEKNDSNWDPSCLVGLNVSYNKSYQIAPDVRTGSGEQDKTSLHLVYKWRGMKSNVTPLTIPLVAKEANQFIQGAIIMYSIYNPENRNLPIEPTNPKTCKEFLEKVNNWNEIGSNIIRSFDITPESIGNILRNHLTDVVNSCHVEQDMENIKPLKKKKAEEQISDLWTKQKKAYLKNIESTLASNATQ